MKNFVLNNGRFFDVGDSITECHKCKFCLSHSGNAINCNLPPTDICGTLAKRLRDIPFESIEEQKMNGDVEDED